MIYNDGTIKQRICTQARLYCRRQETYRVKSLEYRGGDLGTFLSLRVYTEGDISSYFPYISSYFPRVSSKQKN